MPINNAPVIGNPDAVIAAAGTGPVSLGIGVPTDLDGDLLTITLDTVPGYGTVEYFDGFSWQTAASGGITLTAAELQSLRYTPPASGEHGGEAIRYSVDDGTDIVTGTIEATVEVDSPGPAALFFSAANAPGGNPDLYKVAADGTLTPIPVNPPNGSFAGTDGGFFQYNGNLYFNAFTPSTGFTLFTMDPAGTVSAVDDSENPGSHFNDDHIGLGAHFTKFAGSLFLRGTSSSTGDELIQINADGSTHSYDINSGGASSAPGESGGFVKFDHSLFFSAVTTTTNGFNADLMRLDADGTLTEISTRSVPNAGFGSSAGEDGGFAVFNNAIYFNAYSDTLGDTLFRLDAGSTTPVAVDPSGTSLSHFFGETSAFHTFGNALYFNDFSSALGHNTLFKIDAAGTLTALDFGGVALEEAGALGGFADFGGDTYFTATTAATGVDLFKLSAGGTITSIDVNPTDDAFGINLVSGFVEFNGNLYFDAYDGVGLGDSLFQLTPDGSLTNVIGGTGATTNAGVEGGFKELGGSLYFSAYTADGYELVKLDKDGTVNSYDINPGPGANSEPGKEGGFELFPFTVLQGTGGKDVIAGGAYDELLDGEAASDVLEGRGGNDILDGGEGNDGVYGGVSAGEAPLDGADTLHGGSDDDFVQGNGGADEAHGDAGQDTVGGGKGNDTVFGGDGNDVVKGGNGQDEVHGGAGDDSVYGGNATGAEPIPDADRLFGDEGADFVQGNGGADEVHGGIGNDTVRAGKDNDTVSGEADDDAVFGGNGNDVVNGGTGNDTLTGGLDDDKFVFLDGDGIDNVTDFANNGLEKFDLSGLGIAGAQNFGELILSDDPLGPGITVDYLTGSFIIANLNSTSDLDAGDFLF